LPTAVSLAKRRHGHLELVMVHETESFDGLTDAPWGSMSASMQDRYVTDKAAQLSSPTLGPVGHTLLKGQIVPELCRRAQDAHADMIVMSTHGRTGLTRAIAGSVADSLVRHANVPVLLLRQPLGNETRLPPMSFRKILVPIDDSAESHQIFDAVSALAEPGVTEILLLRVVTPVHIMLDTTLGYSYVASPPDQESTDARVGDADNSVSAAAADLAVRSGCDVDPHVIVDERPSSAIVSFARKYNTDLIAMTTHGRGGAARFILGSVTDAVLRRGNVPMLVLRPRTTL
jgi:nucleotide-binding universal stress UspA family protein